MTRHTRVEAGTVPALERVWSLADRRKVWRYLLVDQGVLAVAVNIIINGGIAWLVFRKQPQVPMHGDPSIAGDTRATCFLLPLIACLVVTGLTRREVQRGRLPAGNLLVKHPAIARRLYRNVLLRGLLFGLLGRYALAPAAMNFIVSTGLQQMTLWGFLVFKSLFAGGLAGILCPLYAFLAWRDGELPNTCGGSRSSADHVAEPD